MLERNGGFTVVAVLTFALGIGAVSAVFSLIQGVLLTPPPYPEPERVMLIQALDSRTDARAADNGAMEWMAKTEPDVPFHGRLRLVFRQLDAAGWQRGDLRP